MTPDAARKTLTARRDELLASLTEIEDQLDDPVPKDWEDAASERQGDEVLTALGHAEEAELRRRHTGVEVVVLVTVTGASRSELESAAAEVVASGITAECELRPVWMEQDAAFVAGALPFGRMKL